MAEDAEVKIAIKAEADTSGFQETEAAAEETQKTIEQSTASTMPAQAAQEEQIRKVAEAKQKEKNASAEAAEAEAKLRRAMELAAKSRNELIKELQRLAKLRKEAAESGDVEAFKRLTQQSQETREAFEKLNQGLELTNIQFVQQAQMGMMAGQTLASLGQMAEGGASNVAAMAAQVLSLGQAIKAGLGPIGWAMMLLQGLQMAWDYFSNKQQKAAEAAAEAQKAIAELNETLLRHADAAARANQEAYKGYIDERVEGEERAASQAINAMRRQNAAMKEAADARLEMMRAEIEGEKLVLAAKKEAGDITAAQYKAATEALDARLREAERKEAEAAEERERARLNAELASNEQIAKARSELAERLKATNARGMGAKWTDAENARYAELMAQYKRQQAIIEERKATVDAINKQMEAAKVGWDDKKALARYREQRRLVEEEMRDAQKKVAELDFQAHMSFRGILDMADDNAEARHLTGMALLEYAHTVNRQITDADAAAGAAWDDVEAARDALRTLSSESARRKEGEQAQDRKLTAEQQAAEIAKKAAERERKWADVQRQSLEEQRQWLTEQMKQMAQGSELWREYNQRLRAVNESITAERVATLANKRTTRQYAAAEVRTESEILEADRTLLTNKLEELRAELASEKHLTLALRKSIKKQITETEKQLAGLAAAELKNKLSEVTNRATTQQYKAKDRRTQRQIMEADEAILRARRDELRKLASAPGVDAATQKQINKALQDTERQIEGLEHAWQENRKAASRWLRELQPPKLQAKKKQQQKSLDRLAAAYARAAKKAEQAAAKGDTKAEERYRRQMQRLANSIDRRAKDSQAGSRLQRQADDALRSISRQQVAEGRSAARSARASKRKQKADEDAAKSSEKAARDAKKAAKKPPTQAQKLTGEVTELRAATQRMESELARLQEAVGSLTSAVTSCANVAAHTASLASNAASATSSAISKLQKQNSRLQTQIDHIKRKL